MKTLFLLRHARAGNAPEGKSDMERPLTPAGESAMRKLGQTLAEKNLLPQAALFSPAIRTESTLRQLALGMGTDIPSEREEWLYNAAPHHILEQMKNIPDTVDSILIVGHNPTMHSLAHDLIKDTPGQAGAISDSFPPGTLAIFQLGISSWQESPRGRATLEQIFFP